MNKVKNGDTICMLVFSSGETGSLHDFILGKAHEEEPLLAWAEPEVTAVECGNDSGRRMDFNPLVPGVPDWPVNLPLVEARLFWETKALHVVASDDGICRWVEMAERSGGEEGKEVRRREYDVHTIRDRRRFGLNGNAEKLTAIEYWQQGQLIGCRLLMAGGGDGS